MIFTNTERAMKWTLGGERVMEVTKSPSRLGRSRVGRVLRIPQGCRTEVRKPNILDEVLLLIKEGDLGFSHPDY